MEVSSGKAHLWFLFLQQGELIVSKRGEHAIQFTHSIESLIRIIGCELERLSYVAITTPVVVNKTINNSRFRKFQSN